MWHFILQAISLNFCPGRDCRGTPALADRTPRGRGLSRPALPDRLSQRRWCRGAADVSRSCSPGRRGVSFRESDQTGGRGLTGHDREWAKERPPSYTYATGIVFPVPTVARPPRARTLEMQLLADRVGEVGLAKSISDGTVRHALTKTLSNLG
jgi:hypothetical protein